MALFLIDLTRFADTGSANFFLKLLGNARFLVFAIGQESVSFQTMKLTKRGEYALRALIDLTVAREAGRDLLPLKEIASRESIPLPFLEQIFVQLREGGIVDGKRGKGGGFFLAKPPENIPIGEVVRLIEGPLAPISCASHTAYARCSCPDEEHCGLRLLMLDVRNAISNILDQFSLAQTAKVSIEKLLQSGLPLPFSEAETKSKTGLDYQI